MFTVIRAHVLLMSVNTFDLDFSMNVTKMFVVFVVELFSFISFKALRPVCPRVLLLINRDVLKIM